VPALLTATSRRPKSRDGLVDHHANVVFTADIGFDELGVRTECAKLLDELHPGLLAPPSNDSDGALPCESDGGGASYAREATCDQDNPSNHHELPD